MLTLDFFLKLGGWCYLFNAPLKEGNSPLHPDDAGITSSHPINLGYSHSPQFFFFFFKVGRMMLFVQCPFKRGELPFTPRWCRNHLFTPNKPGLFTFPAIFFFFFFLKLGGWCYLFNAPLKRGELPFTPRWCRNHLFTPNKPGLFTFPAIFFFFFLKLGGWCYLFNAPLKRGELPFTSRWYRIHPARAPSIFFAEIWRLTLYGCPGKKNAPNHANWIWKLWFFSASEGAHPPQTHVPTGAEALSVLNLGAPLLKNPGSAPVSWSK